MINAVKRKLQAGQPCFGAWLITGSADMAEILAYAGLDFVVIDHEHGQGSIESAIAQLRALKGSNCAGILRVPSNDKVYIKRALDAGVDGIMVPNIKSTAEAAAAIAACRYPPDGERGAFAGMRAMRYGARPDYHQTATDDLVLVLQIETAEAVEHIPAIGQLDGIDVLFIGPRDLSASLGRLNQFADPAVTDTIRRAEAAILKSGRILGSTAANGQVAGQMVQRGYGFVIAGSDATLLLQSASQVLENATK